jgi:hypothetical protein
MIKKITALIAAATCTGLIALIASGFSREIAAVAMPFGRLHTGIENDSLPIRPPDSAAHGIHGHMDATGARRRSEDKL